METLIASLMIVMGLGIAVVWTHDIVASDHVDLESGLLAARDPDSGSLFWPHWIAEFGTAAALVTAGAGLIAQATWGRALTGIAAGALAYTSINALGWALAAPERRVYVNPMLFGAAVSVTTIIYVLTA
jgi:hypothetical protein